MADFRQLLSEGALVAIVTGAVGALARWFSDVMNGDRVFMWVHFPMLLVIGAFLGYMGNELAIALNMGKSAALFSGASGAMGAYGFEFYTRVLSRMADVAKDRDEDPERKPRSDAN